MHEAIGLPPRIERWTKLVAGRGPAQRVALAAAGTTLGRVAFKMLRTAGHEVLLVQAGDRRAGLWAELCVPGVAVDVLVALSPADAEAALAQGVRCDRVVVAAAQGAEVPADHRARGQVLRHGPLLQDPESASQRDHALCAAESGGLREDLARGLIHAEDLALSLAVAVGESSRAREVSLGLHAADELERASSAFGEFCTPTPSGLALRTLPAGWQDGEVGARSPAGPLFPPESLAAIVAFTAVRADLLRRGPSPQTQSPPFWLAGRFWRIARTGSHEASVSCDLIDASTGTVAAKLLVACGNPWVAFDPAVDHWVAVNAPRFAPATAAALEAEDARYGSPQTSLPPKTPLAFLEQVLDRNFNERWIAELLLFAARHGRVRSFGRT